MPGLLAHLQLLVCIYSTAGVPGTWTEPSINPRSDALESGSTAAKLFGSKQRALAALLRAQSARAHASSFALYAEQLDLQARTKATVLKDMAAQATFQAEEADTAAKNTVQAFQEVQASSETVEVAAAGLAVAEVQRLMTAQYYELGPWREGILKATQSPARVDGVKAAQPYGTIRSQRNSLMQGARTKELRRHH